MRTPTANTATSPLSETPMSALPSHDDAFLVIDSLLEGTQVVSRRGGAPAGGEEEEDVLDKPVA